MPEIQRFSDLDALAIIAIEKIQSYLNAQGYFPHVHFELEGCVSSKKSHVTTINFSQINKHLAAQGIEGELVPEYWRNQWEYVSLFNGQSPLKEAHNLTKAIKLLPSFFQLQGIDEVLIKPVVWGGDQAQLVHGSKNIFQGLNKAIHIPNAIQLNVSISDKNGDNLIADTLLGECLQQCLINTSFDCALLFLPEPDAFERLTLKSDYQLFDELCSPTDISGGHQGSIALYRQYGKHNQVLGEDVLIVNHLSEPLVKLINWQKTARIEHRLGASSVYYNAYVNVIFVLLNVVDALQIFNNGKASAMSFLSASDATPIALPSALFDDNGALGAYSIFKNDTWFERCLNQIERSMETSNKCKTLGIGSQIKNAILKQYQHRKIVLVSNTEKINPSA